MLWVVVVTLACRQLLDVDPQDQAEEDGGHMDLDSQRKGKCAVIKTSTRQVCACVHIMVTCVYMYMYPYNLPCVHAYTSVLNNCIIFHRPIFCLLLD